jgi:hypothetical protein
MEDRAKLIAFRLEKGERCGLCGTAEWEWDPRQGGKKFAYEAVTKICKGCMGKDVAQEESQKLPGSSIELRPTGTREWAQRQVLRRKRARRRQRERQEDR